MVGMSRTAEAEDLKMKFLSDILPLGNLVDNGRFMTYYEKKISGIVDGIELSVKTDFMVAKGVMSFHQNPYFHFHVAAFRSINHKLIQQVSRWHNS